VKMGGFHELSLFQRCHATSVHATSVWLASQRCTAPRRWIWAYWVSPLSYAQSALAVNEFLAPRWQIVRPAWPLPIAAQVMPCP